MKKLLKFNSIKATFLLATLESLFMIYSFDILSKLSVSSVDALLKTMAVILIAYILKNIFFYLRMYSSQVSQYYIRRYLYERITNHYENLSYNEFKEKSIGERTSSYVNDVGQIVGYTIPSLIEFIEHLTIIIFSLVALYRIHSLVFLSSLILIGIMIFVPRFFEKGLNNAIMVSQEKREIFLGKITEYLTGIFIFISNISLPKFRYKSNLASENFSRTMTDVELFAAIMNVTFSFITNIMTLLILGLNAYLVVKGQVVVGTLLATIGILPTAADSSQLLFTRYAFFKSGMKLYDEKFKDIEDIDATHLTKPFMRRINNLVEGPLALNESSTRSIRTKNLVINYKDHPIHIKDVEFKKGKKYAIVGESGCGKSSLLKAIIGVITNYDGDILIDGVCKEKTHTLYDKIAFVDQDTFLFKDTLANNIKIGNDKVNVREILNKVGLNNFDEDFLVEENGKNLSGGQKQRISLARALARGKDIIFLDETTANLDKDTSILIENLLLDSDLTVVMISHKLNDETKNKIDEIIDLSK